MPRIFDPRTECLDLDDWPAQIRACWDLAMQQRSVRLGTHGYARGLSDRSIEKHFDGFGRYLGFRRFVGDLPPALSLQNCVTPEFLDDYFHELCDVGNSDYCIVGRFAELQAAMRIMDPRGSYGWIARPGGESIRQCLPMEKRNLRLHHPRELFDWGLELMATALDLPVPQRRQVQLRDGLLIAMEALRGIRLRSILSLRLDDSIHKEADTGTWRLAIPPEDVKNAKHIDGALVDILTPWLDRYVGVERQELLAGKDATAFWINSGGTALGEVGLDKAVRRRSALRFGDKGFGTHRFRYCLASTLPLVAPEHPAVASTLLRISHKVMREHYDRSSSVLAFAKHHAAVNAERIKAREVVRDLFGNPMGRK